MKTGPYRHHAQAREQGLSPEARLTYHQTQSGLVLETLHAWLTAQLDERARGTELPPRPRDHLPPQALAAHPFLRQPEPSLDINLERSPKKAILHQKSALSFKTPTGAHVGDLFMSVIHTCEPPASIPFSTSPRCDATPMPWPPIRPRGCSGVIKTR